MKTKKLTVSKILAGETIPLSGPFANGRFLIAVAFEAGENTLASGYFGVTDTEAEANEVLEGLKKSLIGEEVAVPVEGIVGDEEDSNGSNG